MGVNELQKDTIVEVPEGVLTSTNRFTTTRGFVLLLFVKQASTTKRGSVL
jgi:hypothetical protein